LTVVLEPKLAVEKSHVTFAPLGPGAGALLVVVAVEYEKPAIGNWAVVSVG